MRITFDENTDVDKITVHRQRYIYYIVNHKFKEVIQIHTLKNHTIFHCGTNYDEIVENVQEYELVEHGSLTFLW